jgi:hypothetical protein
MESCEQWNPSLLLNLFVFSLVITLSVYFKMDMNARSRLATVQVSGLAIASTLNFPHYSKPSNRSLLQDKSFISLDLPAWLSRMKDPGFSPEIEKIEEVLHPNKDFLVKLHKAIEEKESLLPPPPLNDKRWPSFEAKLPDGSAVLKLCRLIAVDIVYQAHNDNSEKALEELRRLGEIAIELSNFPNLAISMYSSAIVELQKTTLERILPWLQNIVDPVVPLKIITTDNFLSVSFYRALIMEEAMFMFSFPEGALSSSLDELLMVSDNGLLNRLVGLFPYRVFISGYEIDFQKSFWNRTQDFFSKPVYQIFNEYIEWQSKLREHPGGIFSAIAAPNFSKLSITANVGEAHRELINLAAAALAFKITTHDYPSNISDLVPDYIEKAPVDPFDGKPLKMKSIQEDLFLYSIGPDFKDNNGDSAYQLPYAAGKSGDIVLRIGQPEI